MKASPRGMRSHPIDSVLPTSHNITHLATNTRGNVGPQPTGS
jgi:hypothetical protein